MVNPLRILSWSSSSVQAIKNLISQYDKDGDYIDPNRGLAGLLVTEENVASRKRIISISESSLNDTFEFTKRFFAGQWHGKQKYNKTIIYLCRIVSKNGKNDRLAAGHTLSQYERVYTRAFIVVAKAADPTWKAGKPIKSGALDGITRESVEANSKKSSSSLDIKI